MTGTLDEIVLNKKNTHSLAYDLFESSYDKKIVTKNKNDTFYKITNNIHKIISGLDLSYNDEKLLPELNDRIFKNVNYGSNKIYSRDFSDVNPTANCVGYANIMIATLSMLDKTDLLKNATIVGRDDSVWGAFCILCLHSC
jgi:hypothetical protein